MVSIVEHEFVDIFFIPYFHSRCWFAHNRWGILMNVNYWTQFSLNCNKLVMLSAKISLFCMRWMHINYRWVEFNATETQSSHNAIKKSILRRKNCKIQYFLAASIRVFDKKKMLTHKRWWLEWTVKKNVKNRYFNLLGIVCVIYMHCRTCVSH